MDIPVNLSNASVPYSYLISENVPNPFLQQTNFNIFLAMPQFVTYDLYDITGKLVYSQTIGMTSEGNHSIQIDKGKLVSGMYEVVFRIGIDTKTFKILIF